jgi:4-hydroxyphenylpyruvate dioxygenase-like putative hemolysin
MSKMGNKSEIWDVIDQVGVVTDDIDKMLQQMQLIFGLTPTQVIHVAPGKQEGYFRGKPRNASVDIAHFQVGELDLEIICPKQGESLHREFLEKHGSGLYHIRFNVKNYDEAVSEMEKRGFPAVMNGASSQINGARWAYFDTEPKLGYYIEIINLREK